MQYGSRSQLEIFLGSLCIFTRFLYIDPAIYTQLKGEASLILRNIYSRCGKIRGKISISLRESVGP